MITSTYGVKIPQDGDKGSTVFKSLETNIELFRDHTHNGTNTAKIASTDLTKGEFTVSTWTALANGTGFQSGVITCPGSYTLLNCKMVFIITSGTMANQVVHPTIVPESTAQFRLIMGKQATVKVLFI
jgi:hypothetical protein